MLCIKSRLALIPLLLLSAKVTLGSPARLQATSLRLAVANNFLRGQRACRYHYSHQKALKLMGFKAFSFL